MQKKMVLSLILFFLYNVLMFRSLMPVMDRCQTNVSCQSHPFTDGKKAITTNKEHLLPPHVGTGTQAVLQHSHSGN